MPRGARLEVCSLAKPSPLAVIRLDAADGLTFDVEGMHLCSGGAICMPTSMP